MLLFLLLGLKKEIVCFIYLHLKRLVRLEILINLRYWKLNQHTSDLGSLLLTYDVAHEVKDKVANLLLEIWVSFSN